MIQRASRTGAPGYGRSLPKALASLAGASLLAAAVAFVSNILTARALGPELRGSIAFVLQASYFVAPALILASDRVLLRTGSANSRVMHVVTHGSFVLLSLTCSILLAGLFRDWRVLIAPAAMVTGWLLLRRAEVAAHGGYRRYFGPFVAYQLGILLTHSTLFTLGVSEWQWWALAYAAPAAILLWVPGSQRHGQTASARENAPLLFASLTQLWSMRGERIVMPWIAGAEALGLYIVVATATEPLYWIAQAYADHSVGQGAPSSTRDRIRRLATTCAPFAAIATAVGGAVWWLLPIVFGPAFETAKPLVFPLTIASVALAGYRLVNAWVLAGPRPQAVGRLEAQVAIVATIAYLVGLATSGALGAAWACVVVYSSAIMFGMKSNLHPPSSQGL